MIPQYHLLLGLILVTLIKIFRKKTSLLFLSTVFLSSILIDFDHYLVYVFGGNGFSIINAYNWFVEMSALGIKSAVHIFHTIETYLLILLGSYFTNKKYKETGDRKLGILRTILFGIAIGFLFHILTDHLTIMLSGGSRDYSIIYWLFTR